VSAAEIAAAVAQAMSEENHRRDLAGQTPGLGAQMALPQPYADAGQGSPPTVGEGYATEAPAAPAQVYVPHGVPVYGARPHYADDLVGGIGFQGGRSEPAIRYSVSPGLVFPVAAPAKPGLLSRLRGLFRRGQ
jgi:hypothetical protein